MAKQLNINLSVDADVKRAKAAFADLQKTLTNVQASAMIDSKNLFNTEEIKRASSAARELQQHLTAATDAKTGRLNLSTFSNSLEKSKKSLADYKQELERLGPSGEQAFTKVAKSIAMADNPLKRTNGLLSEFKTTLMNTARWQISSSILHGFMGALQSAYGYAQDLNESLNNIRIVTGQSVDQMAEFALKANKAAKELSTTTTEYTNASLIYYQQGLSDSEVKERTDATIKLANVSRQSAEEVSSQMTAIWNNFDDGTKSLEYYEDVITALGASTASSSSEISEGLQKFASVADTVGLSYEKASAAVATVVAETRQSADVVGTAFKTMFARVQGLSLGETLEDGVNLNKYSEALQKVGVNILDSNDKLKDMDKILDELSEKWGNISEGQRVALAETVAGTRQYTQFMALMNNYDKVQKNQNIAKTSEGTIDKQAEIYAESWEGARKRVQASLETIYQTIIDDKFFIGVNNTIATVLEGVNGLIKGLGGMEGIISTASAFIGQKLAKEAPAALQRITDYVRQLNGKANETGTAMQTSVQKWAEKEAPNANKEFEEGNGSAEYMVEVNMIETLAEKKRQYNEYEASYSEQEKKRAQDEIAAIEATGNALQIKAKKLDELKQEAEKTGAALALMSKKSDASSKIADLETMSKTSGQIKALSTQVIDLQAKFKEGKVSEERYKDALDKIYKSAKSTGDTLGGTFKNHLTFLDKQMKQGKISTEQLGKYLKGTLGTGAKQADVEIENLVSTLNSDFKIPIKPLQDFVDLLKQVGVQSEKIPAILEGLKGSFSDLQQHTSKTSEQIISFGSALMQVNAVISSISNLKDVFSNEDATIIEKIGAVIGVLTTAMFAYNAVAKLTKTIQEAETGSIFANIIAKRAQNIEEGKSISQKILSIFGIKAQTAAQEEETTATWLQTVANEGLLATMPPLLAVSLLLVAAFLLIAGAIAGITAIIGLLSDAYNKDALAAERAEEASRNLAEAYKTTKEEYDKLKQTITDHQSALESIESLTKGTREWKDAIKEANEKAKELITNYGLAKDKDYTVDEDGIIKFNEGVEEELLNREADKVAVAEAASIMAAQRAKEARAKSNLTDLKRNSYVNAGIATLNTIESSAGNGLSGAQLINDALIDKAIERLTEGDLSEDFKNNNLTIDDLKDKLIGIDDEELIKSIEKLAKNINENTEAEKASYQIAAQSIAAEDENVQNSKYKEELTNASTKLYEQFEKDRYDKYLKEASDRYEFFGTKGTDDAKKVVQQYADVMELKNFKITNFKDDKTVDVKYTDENGEEQEKAINVEEIASVLAANDASEELSEAMEKLETTITGLDISNNKSNQAVIDFLANGNMSKSTYAEAQDLQKDTNIQQRIDEAGEIKSLSEFGDLAKNIHDDTKKYLMESLDITDEDAFEEKAKELGYKSGDAFVSEFNKQQSNIKKEWDKITIDDRGLDNIEDMSLESAKKLQSTLEDIDMGPTGKKAGEDYINGINKMLEGVSSKDMSKAQDALAAIDWSSWDALKQADKTLQQFNVDIDTSSEEWKEWAAEMRIAAGATPDFAQMKADIADVTNTLSKLDFGKTISDADYQKLISSGSDEWKQYFQAQADGTMKFIGNVEELKKANQDQIKDMETTLQKRKELQEKFNELDFTYTDDDTGKTKNVQWDKLKSNTSRKEKAEIADQLLSNEDSKKVLEELGYDEETVRENIRLMVEEDDAAARHYINEMYERIGEFQEEKNEENIQQTKDMYAATAETLNELADMYSEGVINEEAYNKQLTVFAMSAKSLQELQTMVSDYGLSADTYSSALINLAGNYDNCTNELLEYQKALASGSTELATSTQALLENAIAIGEMSAALDLEAEEVEEQAKELISVNGLSEENYKIASKVAILNQSMNKGVSTLVDNWSEYKKTLQSAQKGTEDYAEAALNTKKALSSLLGVLDEDYIPDDFLELPGVMDLIDKATEGDEDAINQLGMTMAKATIEALEFKEGLEGIDGVKLTSDEFENYKNEVLEGITSLTEAITNGTLQAGDDITTLMDSTGESWINSLNEMAYATGMSVDEMKSLLNELGVEAEVVTKDKEVETQVPEYTTYEADLSNTTDENSESLGNGYKPIKKSVTVQTGTKKVKGSISVAQINVGKENKGKAPTITYAGRNNVSSSALEGSSSSDSSSNKTTSAASTDHSVNRYSAEENAVNGLTKQLERLSTAKDNAYGNSKIKAIEKEIAKLKELKSAQEDYLDAVVGSGNAKGITQAIYQGKSIGQLIASGQTGGTIKADYQSLFGGASASGKNLEYTAKDDDGNQWLVSDNYSLAGLNSAFGTSLGVQLDSYGNILNKDDLFNIIQRLKNQENLQYASYADPSARQTTEHNKRIAYLEEFKERLEQYEDTATKLNDLVDEELERVQALQEKNAELISTKMSTGVELGKNSLTRLERAIKLLGDDTYKSAEKMAKFFDIKMNQNQEAYAKQASSYDEAEADIKRRVALYQENPLDENALSPSKAAEMIQTIEDGRAELYENITSDLEDLKNAYGNVTDYWKEKIDKVNKEIEFNISTLDHLSKVFSLLGKNANYESLGVILDAQVDISLVDYNDKKRIADSARALYEEHKKVYNKLKTEKQREEYESAILEKDREYLYEVAQQEQAALEALIEAREAQHENNLNKIYQRYEQSLAGEYGTFDNLDQAMKNQQSLADEYLTTTNKVYETNKMLRSISQDIEKTDSRIAKNKLKSFSNEITALQKRDKLTKNDLALAQARYKILQAQIALEEARDAKTTVRLKRDSEGNYGYIYTADQDKISNAEQAVEDAENEYYNLNLQQYNDYNEKYLTLKREYSEQRKALDKLYYEDGLLSEDQYNKALEELNNTFQEKELIYKEAINERGLNLDQVAAEGRTEAWTNSFTETITAQELFNEESLGAAQGLNNDLQSEMQDWVNVQDDLLSEAGLNNKDFKQTVKEVKDEIESLGKQITKKGGLVDQMNQNRSATEKLTEKFILQYQKLETLADKYLRAANEASNYRDKLISLAEAQRDYNAAISSQPSANVSNSGGQSYTPTSSGSGNGNSGNTSTFSNSPESKSEVTVKSTSGWKHNATHHWKVRTYSNGKTKNINYEKHNWIFWQDIQDSQGYSKYYYKCKCGGTLYKKIKTDTARQYNLTPENILNNNQIERGYGFDFDILTLKTGGYTGSWNGANTEENGKLAFLHQKELVLNADDTENMLSAVKLIRQINQTIDLQAAAQSASLQTTAAQFQGNEQTLQQEVTIHAEFPNATDHNEIEEAFNNLVNRASQYANRF